MNEAIDREIGAAARCKLQVRKDLDDLLTRYYQLEEDLVEEDDRDRVIR